VTHAHVIARNAAVGVAAEVISKVTSVVLYAVMARELGQSGFGEFTFVISLCMLLLILAGPGTNDILTREIARDRATLPKLLWSTISVKIVLGVPAIALAYVISIIAGYDTDVQLAVVLLGTSQLVETVSKSLQVTFLAYDDLRPVAKALLLQRTATTVVGIAVLATGGGLVAISAVFLLGALLAPVYLFRQLISLRGWVPVTLSLAAARQLYVLAFPLGLSAIFTTVLFRVDAVILAWFKPDAIVGLYGAAYRVLDSTLFLSWTFVSVLMPTLSRGGEGHASTFQGGSKVLLAVLAPIGLIFALFAEPIMRTIYGPGYTDGATALRLLGATAMLFGLSHLAQTTLVTQDRQKVIPWLTGGFAIENVALNLALIPSLSLEGAALATSITEITRCAVLYLLARPGHISLVRIAVGPVGAGLVMVGIWALNLPGLVALLIAPLAYAGTLYLIESRLNPADLTQLKNLVLRRHAEASDQGAAPPVPLGP
jgi:O-antigen/teichoic acid export membrane protein